MPRDRAGLQLGLALGYRDRGELDRAMELSSTALAVFSEIAETEAVADLYNNIGSIHALRGERRAARSSYGRSLALLGNRANLQTAEALRELARLDMEEGRLNEAVGLARAALEAAFRFRSDLDLARCSLVLAQALMGAGRVQDAVAHLPRARAIFAELGLRQSAIVAAQLLRDAENDWSCSGGG